MYPASEEEPQNFFCYGCKAGGDLINLIVSVEDVTAGQAIRTLVKDFDIKDSDALEYSIQGLKKANEKFAGNDPDGVSIAMSKIVYNFMVQVGFSEPYFSRCEKMLKMFDACLGRMDIEQAVDIYDVFCDEIYPQQKEQFEMEQESKLMEAAVAYAQIK